MTALETQQNLNGYGIRTETFQILKFAKYSTYFLSMHLGKMLQKHKPSSIEPH